MHDGGLSTICRINVEEVVNIQSIGEKKGIVGYFASLIWQNEGLSYYDKLLTTSRVGITL